MGGSEITFFGTQVQSTTGEKLEWQDIILKFIINGFTLDSIRNLSIFEYKKYLDAINKRDLNTYKMNAIIFRASMMNKNDFNNFISGFDSAKNFNTVLSERSMRDIGYGSKK